MSATFHFVQDTPADKKLMRRHVMKGKNSGKRFSRTSRLGLQEARRWNSLDAVGNVHEPLRVAAYKDEKRIHESRSGEWIYLSLNSAARSMGNIFLTFELPFNITPASLRTINDFFYNVVERLYPLRLGLSLHEMKLQWLHVLAMDPESFDCCISLMTTCNEIFSNNGQTSSRARWHLSRTFAAIKERLASENALADSTIALVCSLISQEQMRRHDEAAAVHAQGLWKLVELRGGIDELDKKTNLLLVLKICKADILFALQSGGPTACFRDRIARVRKTLASKGINFPSPIASVGDVSHLHADLVPILRDVMGFCVLFNEELRSRTLDSLNYLDIITSLLYRLLRFRQLGQSIQQHDENSAYSIGMVMFIMTTFIQRASKQIIQFEILLRRLNEFVNGSECVPGRLRLWVLMIGAIWVGEDTDEQILASMRSTAKTLGLDDWESAQSHFASLPWLHAVHDEPGSVLWKQLMPSQ